MDMLVKARYQDNLEFCQWLKRYYDLHYSGTPYDPVARRSICHSTEPYYIAGGNKVNPMASAKANKAAVVRQATRPTTSLASSVPSAPMTARTQRPAPMSRPQTASTVKKTIKKEKDERDDKIKDLTQ